MKTFCKMAAVVCTFLFCTALFAAKTTPDMEIYQAVQEILPEGKTFYSFINVRNIDCYGSKYVKLFLDNLSAEVDIPPDAMDNISAFWSLLGLDQIKAVGGADSLISPGKGIYESVFTVYSGKPLDGLVKDMFRGSFDTVKVAGSWPASTVFAFRGNLRFTPAAKAYHENIEPVPFQVIEGVKALSGRYSIVCAEDNDGSILFDCIIPDNESSFIFYFLYAASAGNPEFECSDGMINFQIAGKNKNIDIFILRGKKMLRICSSPDAAERMQSLPKLKDDPAFIELTAGMPSEGEFVGYSGKKMINPQWVSTNEYGELVFSDLLTEGEYDCTSISTASFTDKGIISRTRTYGAYYEIIIRNIAGSLKEAVDGIRKNCSYLEGKGF